MNLEVEKGGNEDKSYSKPSWLRSPSPLISRKGNTAAITTAAASALESSPSRACPDFSGGS